MNERIKDGLAHVVVAWLVILVALTLGCAVLYVLVTFGATGVACLVLAVITIIAFASGASK